mmetsp:Transcript_9960/g.32488  ORF Transcript_9960/g.32488 Transcript_9960/m.32488 type:complete len:500 (-) Transcript_9960:160-1659(-)
MRCWCLVSAWLMGSESFVPRPAPPRRVPFVVRGGGRLAAKETRGREILASLALIYVSNQWCRSLLFSTVNFASEDGFKYVNAALDLTEGDYALLGTLAFQALFSVASLAAGAAVDRVDAAAASVVACAAWSVATAAIGLGGDSFATVAAFRALQGVAMSVTAPAGYSLLARTFEPSKLASANSAYAAAVSIGGALASASVALDEQVGWRATFGLVGAVGVGIAAVSAAFLAKNDLLFSSSSASSGSKEKTLSAKTPVVVNEETKPAAKSPLLRPATLLLLSTAALRYCAGFTIAVFALPLFRGAFPEQAVQFGVAYAVVVAACGSASAFVGGRLADAVATKAGGLPVWPFSRNENAARALVPFCGSALAAPLWLAATHAPTLELAIAGLALEFFVAECWIGTTAALLANEVPPGSRGFAQGLFTALTIVGNLAPLAVGRAVAAGAASTSTLVDAAVVLGYGLSAAGFLATAAFLGGERAASAVVSAQRSRRGPDDKKDA